MNDHWNVLYQVTVFYADRKYKMAVTAGHRLTLDPMGKCSKAFFSETTNMIKAKLYMNVHWMVLYNLKDFCSDMKFKMAATAGLSLTLDPMGKMFQNASWLFFSGEWFVVCQLFFSAEWFVVCRLVFFPAEWYILCQSTITVQLHIFNCKVLYLLSQQYSIVRKQKVTLVWKTSFVILVQNLNLLCNGKYTFIHNLINSSFI